MRGKIKAVELLIISKKLMKPKKKIRLNKEIEKLHIEKEEEPDYMINTNVINSRFCK